MSHKVEITSADIPDFVCYRDSDTTFMYLPEKNGFDRLCRKMYKIADESGSVDASVRYAIDALYSAADSVSSALSDIRPLTGLSMMLGECFAIQDSPLRSDEILEQILMREYECETYNAHDRLGIKWRIDMVRKHLPGTTVVDLELLGSDGEQTSLHKELSNTTLLFIYKDNCGKCKEIVSDIHSSRRIRSAVKRRELDLVAIYSGEDSGSFMDGSQLKAFGSMPWRHFWDRNEAVTYRNAFDPSRIPSCYLLSADGKVMLKAETDIGKISGGF